MPAPLARTPEADRAVRWFVERVQERVLRETPDAEALVLTGSACRGEATVLPWRQRSLVLSDLDFAVLFADARARDRAGARLARASRELGREFARWDFLGAVDLGAYALADLPAQAPRPGALEWERSGMVLAGEPSLLDRLPRYPASAIPPEEALLLCENRLLELLWLEPRCEGPEPQPLVALYAGGKGVLDAALARLLSLGLCPGGVEGRYEACAAAPGAVWHDLARLAFWTRFKLEPRHEDLEERFGRGSTPAAWARQAWREGAEALLAAYRDLVERHTPPRGRALLARAAGRARLRRRLRRAWNAWREGERRGLTWASPRSLLRFLAAGAPEHVLGATAAELVAEAVGGAAPGVGGPERIGRAPVVASLIPAAPGASWEERRARAVEAWDRWVLRGARHGSGGA